MGRFSPRPFGIFLLDKPKGKSSNQALQKVKALFGAKKAGHTGSLDPLASGILPICLNEATKIARFFLDADKRYVVHAQLGRQTETGDGEGAILKTLPFANIDRRNLEAAVQKFIGKIDQTPPMYSALKKNGVPLYRLARAGKTVLRKPRTVTIYAAKILSFDPKNGEFSLDIHCSKGTYIRTLVEDIARALNNVAFVSDLRRTGFAHYTIDDATTLENLAEKNAAERSRLVISADAALSEFSTIFLDAPSAQKIRHGQPLKHEADEWAENALVKLRADVDGFFGIGIFRDGKIFPKRIFEK